MLSEMHPADSLTAAKIKQTLVPDVAISPDGLISTAPADVLRFVLNRRTEQLAAVDRIEAALAKLAASYSPASVTGDEELLRTKQHELSDGMFGAISFRLEC